MIPQNCYIFFKEDVDRLLTSKLFGYGFTDDAVIIGTKGLSEYLSTGRRKFPKEGRFSGIFIVSDNEIVIKADATGQDVIYLYENKDDWAVSNSFLLLAEAVKNRGKLHACSSAIVGFHLKAGVHIGEQLISHKTMIEEISVVPITTELSVHRQTKRLTKNSRPYLDAFSLSDDEDYSQKFIDVMERGSGIMGAMSEAGLPMHLLLSGGYDSRLALSMILANGRPEKNFRVSSHEFKVDDFRVANSISTLLGLPLNVPGPEKKPTLSDSDAIRMYMIGSGATYLPFYPVSSHSISKNAELRITGDQPTGWSHFAGNARFNGDANKIASDIEFALRDRGYGQEAKKDFMSTFEILDIDHEHPAAMLAHYSAIRSRHHCGRNWYRSLGVEFLFTPLMQSSFVSLDLYNAEQGFHPKKFFADAFSAFGGWALNEPFETPDRSFDHDLLENSPFKGGVKIQPRSYKLYGSIEPNKDTPNIDIFSINMRTAPSPNKIKSYMQEMFYKSHAAKSSNFFIADDFAKANGEIHADGTLSHGYRKLTHIVSTDIVLRIIEESGKYPYK